MDDVCLCNRQAQYDAAVLARKRYREQILSDRIADYTAAKNELKLKNIRPNSNNLPSESGMPGTPIRSQEYFTKSLHSDEDFISFDLEYSKYLGDHFSMPDMNYMDSNASLSDSLA